MARLEGGESPIEISNNINLTNEWVNYVFDFSLSANDQTQLKIFFNHNITNGTLTRLSTSAIVFKIPLDLAIKLDIMLVSCLCPFLTL